MSCVKQKYGNLKNKYKKLQDAYREIRRIHVGGTLRDYREPVINKRFVVVSNTRNSLDFDLSADFFARGFIRGGDFLDDLIRTTTDQSKILYYREKKRIMEEVLLPKGIRFIRRLMRLMGHLEVDQNNIFINDTPDIISITSPDILYIGLDPALPYYGSESSTINRNPSAW